MTGKPKVTPAGTMEIMAARRYFSRLFLWDRKTRTLNANTNIPQIVPARPPTKNMMSGIPVNSGWKKPVPMSEFEKPLQKMMRNGENYAKVNRVLPQLSSCWSENVGNLRRHKRRYLKYTYITDPKTTDTIAKQAPRMGLLLSFCDIKT